MWTQKHVIQPVIEPAIVRLFGFGLLVMVGLAAIGCQSGNPHAARALAQRRKNMDQTVTMISKIDEHRDEQMAATLATLQTKHEHDLRETATADERIDAWISEDFQDWQAREPLYRRAIQRQLQARPTEIERTWPMILY